MKRTVPARTFGLYAAVLSAILVLTGCAAAEPRPAGVSRFVSFSVSPIYPRSFEIAALSYHSIYGHSGVNELKEAWRKKALQIANGRKFKTSPLVVHDTEDDTAGVPTRMRSVKGTITLID